MHSRRIRFGIGVRIGAGFALFIGAVGVLFLLTRSTLNESRAISRRIDGVWTPSLRALEGLDRTVSESRVLVRHWIAVQSRSDDPEKVELQRILDAEFPAHLAALDGVARDWDPESRARLDTLKRNVEHLRVVCREVMRLLPEFTSYEDPNARMEAEYLALEGSSLQVLTLAIRVQLDALAAAQTESLAASAVRLEQLGDRLRLYAGQVALGVLVLGIAIAWAVTRSIVRPVRLLKRVLLQLGRGVPPSAAVPVGRDEVGEMADAVNRLADGLQRTREFSIAVGRGQFDTPYEPLGPDDALGHTLLSMRDALAVNERDLEGKVELRTRELQQAKATNETILNDLQGSIRYAERIQNTMLPTPTERAAVFGQSAVFFRPRNVVSGDFYWFHNVSRHRIFAVVDCTGHGVPGAFMSLIGHDALEHVTKVYVQPDRILDSLNRKVAAALRIENGGLETVQDGMDLAVVSVDMERMVLQYSGAHCPLYVVRGGAMVHTLTPDKFSIASFTTGRTYTLHEVPVQPGDVVFAATDGFADQFGGPEGKKFMRHRLRELFVEVADAPIHEVEGRLSAAFDRWRGAEEQVDDVLVVAVRI
jgi:serine phosphatase RsbU (regulator of sigma subunit)/HAMP domain-containing protein